MIPNTRYAKMVTKSTGEVFAYFERTNRFNFPEAMELWINTVFDTWTIPDVEFDTYARGFEVAPIIDFADFAIIALVDCYGFDRHGWAKMSGDGPWYFEAKRK